MTDNKPIKKAVPQPIMVIELDKLTVAEMINRIDAGDDSMRWPMLAIQAAIARLAATREAKRIPPRRD